ncbi:hypothetical protein V6617_01290 [Pelagibacterium nitratireducens]|uniref:Uncharacterized protein n=1 Tax=Pelagibacterium nitratireducens TaxID=1046114 RepID=A0ABZ2HZY0_9HYPH
MALTTMEGTASKIRTDLSVHGTMNRGKGSVSSTTTMNFLIDGRAVFAKFGEKMNINEGDQVCVAGVPKSNGFKALAYNNLTNGAYGDGGLANRILGIFLFVFTFLISLVVPYAPIVIVAPIVLFPISIGLLIVGFRSKAALGLCRQSAPASQTA